MRHVSVKTKNLSQQKRIRSSYITLTVLFLSLWLNEIFPHAPSQPEQERFFSYSRIGFPELLLT